PVSQVVTEVVALGKQHDLEVALPALVEAAREQLRDEGPEPGELPDAVALLHAVERLVQFTEQAANTGLDSGRDGVGCLVVTTFPEQDQRAAQSGRQCRVAAVGLDDPGRE